MLISPLILAAALQMPVADDRTARSLFHRSPSVSGKEDVTTIKAEFWIDEKGKARDCTLLDFEGSEEIANRFCRKAIGIVFQPATDQNGEPVHAMLVETLSVFPPEYETLTRIQKNRLRNELQTVKLSLDVSTSGNDFQVPPFVNLVVLIDDQGRQSHCEGSDSTAQEWIRMACEQSGQVAYEVRKSRKGDPVPYVRMVTAEFLSVPSQ